MEEAEDDGKMSRGKLLQGQCFEYDKVLEVVEIKTRKEIH
jgi:hypothetical protein